MGAKKGPLETRIERRRLGLLGSEAAHLKQIAKWAAEDHKKLLLLRDRFGIADSPECFYELALALAREHVVGFQERTPTSKWTDLNRGYLVVEIERLIADSRRLPGHTVSWAADTLAKRQEWNAFVGGKGADKGEALRVQYHSFKRNRWAEVMRHAYKLHVHNDTLAEWQANLIDALNDPHGLANL